MPRVLGVDHVVFAAADLRATCAFYDRLFGARTHLDYAPDGRSLVRQIALGGALLSVHQEGNGLELVARRPTVGGADLCLRWSGSIDRPRTCYASTESRSLTARRVGTPPTGGRRFRSTSGTRTATYWRSWRRMEARLSDVFFARP
jgi:catechol 2,3-dioxygenase-like lactoylglutathione lyase family enzyme